MSNLVVSLLNEEDTLNLGKCMAQFCTYISVIYLYGSLGVGKTTLSRGFLRAMGYLGNIKSPTYSLVESYSVRKMMIYHLDLYRITNPEELEFMGIREYFSTNTICLVEWPQNGVGILPNPDVSICLNYLTQVAVGREARINAASRSGNYLLKHLAS